MTKPIKGHISLREMCQGMVDNSMKHIETMKKEYTEISIIDASRIFNDAISNDRPAILAFKDGHKWITGNLDGVDRVSRFPFTSDGVQYNRCAEISYPDLISKNNEIESVYYNLTADSTVNIYHQSKLIATIDDRGGACEELLSALGDAGILGSIEVMSQY